MSNPDAMLPVNANANANVKRSDSDGVLLRCMHTLARLC